MHCALKGPAELFELTLADLRSIYGVSGKPTFKHHCVFPKAIPQYEIPEVLDNGDIIIRRRKPKDTKAPDDTDST